MLFADLDLSDPILQAVAAEGYATATPIQAKTIPHTLAGRDVLGCAQTGTGKTAAFALPILHNLAQNLHNTKGPAPTRCLVLSPTRELALQIADSFKTYGSQLPLRGTTIYGGVSQKPQVAALRRGVDVIIATPGRLLDLINQGHIDLSHLQVLVLDEADRMLDMGFIHDIKRIVAKAPKKRQTLLFSATLPPEIIKLSKQFLHHPAEVHIAPESKTADHVEQSVYFVEKRDKPALLAHLLKTLPVERAIIFTRTKHGADKVVKQLRAAELDALAIHGNKSQAARARTLDTFRKGKVHLLVATDVASRGIDIDNISHVFNYDLPNEPESYVHRIGRTARAGNTGTAISFCARDEKSFLKSIERLLKTRLPAAALPADFAAVDAPDTSDAEPTDPDRSEPDASSRTHAPRRSTGPGKHRKGKSRPRNAQQPASSKEGGKPKRPKRSRQRST